MKNILSFDVGMKNLAYCLFQVSDDANNTSDYKVLQWEVINLCTPIVKKCNNGGLNNCGENAKYCKTIKIAHNEGGEYGQEDADENEIEYIESEYYCNKHAKKCKFKIPPSELDITKVKKRKMVDIQGIIDKYNIKPIYDISHEPLTPLVYNIPNVSITQINPTIQKRQKNTKEQMLDMIQHELEANYLENIENIRADQIDLLTLGKNMMTELDKFINHYTNTNTNIDSGDIGIMGGLGKYKIDIVIIENQISTIASRMKTLQGMIAQYFIMRGTPCIEFISAANKLKMFMTKKKTTYTERKIESVEVTKELLEKLPQFEKYRGCLEKNKKKDDLADCFLQGIYYLTLKKMINIDIIL
uniref:Mitochondrial resolvase Ydc2 catalytic domain-containing protein n=1 Tax=viral metagenome TaxID=1070528 RepID=A0A6C0EYB4_9ZZZZ